MLPGFLLMLACGWAYTTMLAGRPELAGLFLGVQAAVLAIILRAVHRIGEHILLNGALVGIAVIAFAGTLAVVPFWVLLLAAGISYTLLTRPLLIWSAILLVAGLTFLLIDAGGQQRPTAAPSAAAVSTLALFVAGLKGGLLTFGGAYTAIPYVRDDTVGRGWLSDAAFLDGVAVAGLLPAPLVIFATFAGYVAGGWAGALAITAGMFLPAFAFSLIFFERLEALVENPTLHRLLDGVAAAVVGIIAATFIDLGASTIERAPDLLPIAAIFLLAGVAAWRLKGQWVVPALILAAAVMGALFVGA